MADERRGFDRGIGGALGGVSAPRLFDEDEIRARLRMADLIDAVERALVEFSAGRVEQPVRTVLEYGGSGRCSG